MKKIFIAFLSAALCAVSALTMTACAAPQKVKLINISLSQEQYGVAIKKGDTATKAKVDEILTKLSGEGIDVNGQTVTFNTLYTAEMNGNSDISIGTVKTSSSNRATELVVATNAEFAPFEYMIGDSFGGIDMQVAKILASKMGKTLVIKHMDFDAVLEDLKNGNSDIAMAGLTINAERAEEVDFSVAYYDTTQYIAVLESDTTFDDCTSTEEVTAKLKELKVTAGAAKAQTGYFYLTGNESFEFEGYSNLNVKAYKSIAMAVQDLSNGKIKLVCGDKDTLTAAINAVNEGI